MRPLMRHLRRWVLLLPLGFLMLSFLYPLFAILRLSLTQDTDGGLGSLNLSGFAEIATSSYYLNTLWFTAWQAAVSTLLTLALALPGAYVFTRYRFPGRGTLLALSALPFVLPTVVAATAFTALIGPRGLVNTALMDFFALAQAPINLERSLTAIFIVHVFYNYAVALRMIAGYWANQSTAVEEAAQVLGAQGWRLWWEIRLPMLRPAVTAAAALVYIFTFTSFGVVLILGGLRYATLEVEIYQQALFYFDLPMAAALSLLQIAVMFAMMLLYTRLQRRIPRADLRAAASIARRPATRREWGEVLLNLGVMIVLVFAPLAALVIRSFTLADGGLDNYLRLFDNPRGSILFVPPMTAVGNSLAFALVTTVFALFLGTLTAYLIESRRGWGRLLDPLFMLPLATSAVTLGFGYIITLNRIDARLLIPLVHTLVALPFVIRNVLPALRAIPPEVREAAQVLGADGWHVWRRVELPLIGRGLTVGAAFAFTVSMGEFGASLFLARPDTPTLPVVIYRLYGQPGVSNYAGSIALSVILMAVCAAAFLLIERLRVSGQGAGALGEF